jgi:hypothetical protein
MQIILNNLGNQDSLCRGSCDRDQVARYLNSGDANYMNCDE